jgi:hypothetical protein
VADVQVAGEQHVRAARRQSLHRHLRAPHEVCLAFVAFRDVEGMVRHDELRHLVA